MTMFPVTVSEGALAQIARIAERQGKQNEFVRLGVKGGGCSGYEYVIRFEAEPRPTDLQVEIGGRTLICDPKSAKLLEGSVLEYTGNLIGGGFKFENPNAGRSCGCGTSFTPKSA